MKKGKYKYPLKITVTTVIVTLYLVIPHLRGRFTTS